MIVRNKIKCLLISLLLLAGVYCSWGCSCCADCYKKCCGKGDNKNENNNNETSEENKEQKDLYFKIEGEAIDNNDFKCFGNGWFEEYKNKKDKDKNSILLYKLTEQKNKEEEAGTLVYSKENEKLQYRNGGDLPDDLKDSDNKWAIFKVTTLKNKKQKGNSHIFYCSDVSTLNDCGLFEEIDCWSIEILAANTQGVETFCAMFYKTNSYLERCVTGNKKSGFIGLGKLNLSGAKNLSMMFYEALYKQKTVDSLKDWILKNGAEISFMFCVDASKFVDKNAPNFRVLNGWVVGRNVYLICCLTISKYNIFFQGDDNGQNNNKLPEWYADRIK